MAELIFDANGFLQVDLQRGIITSPGNEHLALVPVEVIAALERSEAVDQAIEQWGRIHGDRLAATLGQTGEAAGMETLAEYISGTLAAMGMGMVRIEIRGNALMFRAGYMPEGDTAVCIDLLLTGFISGYLGALAKRKFEVISIGKSGGEQLFWAGNPQAVDQVRRWIDEGTAPLESVERLSGRSG